MKGTKATLALFFLLLTLLFALPSSALAWDDLNSDVLANYGITEAQVSEISDGYDATTWGPYRTMLRQHFAKMAVEAFDLDLTTVIGLPLQSFSDVPLDHPYYLWIEVAAQAGLVQGRSPGVFDPESAVTREQAAAIIARRQAHRANLDLALRYDAALIAELLTPFGDQAAVGIRPEMASAVEWGIVRGAADKNLLPGQKLSRIQGAAMLVRSSRDLSDVHFTDSEYGWVVGSDGLIMHTRDGGQSWVPQLPPTSRHINEVHFFDRFEGFAGTALGLLLYTSDGGENWEIANSSFLSFFGLDFIDRVHGWALDEAGGILRTKDGGVTWVRETLTPLLSGVSFVNPQRGWISGTNGYIGYSADGGATWAGQTTGVTGNLNAIHMANATLGWAVGDAGVILATVDGSTWTPQGTPTSADLTDVVFGSISIGWVDNSTGWAVDRQGTILTTTDGGQNWQVQLSGTGTGLSALDLGADVWAVGRDSTILRSEDGTSWDIMFPAS